MNDWKLRQTREKSRATQRKSVVTLAGRMIAGSGIRVEVQRLILTQLCLRETGHKILIYTDSAA